MKLIIVESPAKARTIERFLGDGYRVLASYGHIRDLPARAADIPAAHRKKPWARLGVDVENGYRPLYVVTPESKPHVAALRKALKEAEAVILATDEDREGEAISWHVLEVLRPGVPVERIAFHEITREAVADALAHPRDVDRRLVEAQETRRVLDRLFGYSLSPVLWKKVRTRLSAGRVQSVALRLVVEREEQRRRFRVSAYWDLEGDVAHPDGRFTARLAAVDGRRPVGSRDFDPETGAPKATDAVLLEEERASALAAAAAAVPWRVVAVQRKETRKKPQPPLTTSTLQQAASSRLGFSPRRTMQLAQILYEGVDLGGGEREGLITYMRTDSLNLSEQALAEIQDWVRSRLGAEYTDGPVRYRTRSRTAQEAHEAIRPTHPSRTPQDVAPYLDKDLLALYDLIWRRTVASQMTPARLDRTTVDLQARTGDAELLFRATGSVVRFPGFLAVAGAPEQETVLPPLAEGDVIQPVDAAAADAGAPRLAACRPVRHETQPPARFTEATLVKRLEELGIGRPSTYAPTIATIQQRGYVAKRGKALVPTCVGWAVVDLLRRHFDHYIDTGFTAQLEERLDAIAAGSEDRVRFLDRFWRGDDHEPGLSRLIEQELPRIDYPAIPVGEDPETGQTVYLRLGRTSPYLQVGDGEEARRIVLPAELHLDELTPDKVAELLRQPEQETVTLGTDPATGLPVTLRHGPFGPYIQLGEQGPRGGKPKRVGLGRDADLAAIDLATALQLLALPRELGTDPETGHVVKAGLGRLGPYVVRDGVYANLDSLQELLTIDLDAALRALAERRQRNVLAEIGPHPATGAPLRVLKGRFGPYVTDGETNASLPRGSDPAALTPEEAAELLAAAAERRRRGGKKTARKKASRKKTTARKTTRKKTAKKAGRATAPHDDA